MRKNPFSKDYTIFALVTAMSVMLAVVIFAYFSFRSSSIKNARELRKSAKNIEAVISESFDYTNQINSHIGQQIVHHGANDLKFILELFRESEKIKHRNSDLFSWSSFDWVDSDGYQVVNSRLGIRKDPPSMLDRQYTTLSPQHPWTLQISSPVNGDPSQVWVIPAGTGVVDKSGKYLGTVVVGFDIAQFMGQIIKKVSEKVSFVVLDQDLKIVMQSVDIDLAQDSDFFQKNYDPRNFSAASGILGKDIKIGDIFLSNYAKTSKYSYIILVGFDKSLFNSQFSDLLLPRILEFLCIAVFFLILLYLFETRITSLLRIESNLRLSLEKANQAKDKILFSIAHDIKNQIFGIHGLAKIILDAKNKSEISASEDLQMVETISEQSDEMMEFVKDLLDSNQIESGEFNLRKIKEHDLKSLIGDVVLMSGSVAANNQVKLKINIEHDLPKLRCDARRVKQILTNLVNNAIKYSRAEGDVAIAAKYLHSDQKIRIEIIDSGYGMSAKEVQKYLDGKGGEIDKTDIAKNKKLDSHGIGMPIVLKLIELHQGKIEVESKKGLGTKISLFFDVSRSVDIVEGRSVTDDKQGATVDKSILLVEDNPVNIKVTKRMLESSGYKVSHVENGREALEILDKEKFDLILMDGEMPIMTGYEAAMAIRDGKVFVNFKDHKSIPIIALMSCSDEKTIKRAKDSGMNDHVEKSTSKTRLFEVIERHLKC